MVYLSRRKFLRSLSASDLIPGLDEIREIRFGRKVAIEDRRSVKRGYGTTNAAAAWGMYMYARTFVNVTLPRSSGFASKMSGGRWRTRLPASIRFGSIVLVWLRDTGAANWNANLKDAPPASSLSSSKFRLFVVNISAGVRNGLSQACHNIDNVIRSIPVKAGDSYRPDRKSVGVWNESVVIVFFTTFV